MSYKLHDIFPTAGTTYNIFAHQVDAIRWMNDKIKKGDGFILGDEMGLGKTIETLATLEVADKYRPITQEETNMLYNLYLNPQQIHEVFERVPEAKSIFVPKKYLIICSLTLKYYWIKEALKYCPNFYIFEADDISVTRCRLNGDNIETGDIYPIQIITKILDKPIIVITNKDRVKPVGLTSNGKIKTIDIERQTSLDTFVPELTPYVDISWDGVIVDEAHMIKNGVLLVSDRSNKMSVVKPVLFFRLMRLRLVPKLLDENGNVVYNGGVKIALTGTPIQNRLSDVVSLFKFIGITFYNGSVMENLTYKQVAEIIAQRMFARKQKNLINDLKQLIGYPKTDPEIENVIVNYETAEERIFYEHVTGTILGTSRPKAEFLMNYMGIVAPERVIEKMTMLKILSADIDMFILGHNEKHGTRFPLWPYSKSKYDLMVKHMYEKATTIGGSFCLFSHYKQEVIGIQLHIQQKAYEYYATDPRVTHNFGYTIIVIDGEDSGEGRLAKIEQGRQIAASGGRVGLLIQIKTGGEGLNITYCDTAFFPSGEWNPQLDNQALARLQRIGQHKQVYVKKYIHQFIKDIPAGFQQSIDGYIKRTQEIKLGIADQFINNAQNAAYWADRIDMPGQPGVKAVVFDETGKFDVVKDKGEDKKAEDIAEWYKKYDKITGTSTVEPPIVNDKYIKKEAAYTGKDEFSNDDFQKVKETRKMTPELEKARELARRDEEIRKEKLRRSLNYGLPSNTANVDDITELLEKARLDAEKLQNKEMTQDEAKAIIKKIYNDPADIDRDTLIKAMEVLDIDQNHRKNLLIVYDGQMNSKGPFSS